MRLLRSCKYYVAMRYGDHCPWATLRHDGKRWVIRITPVAGRVELAVTTARTAEQALYFLEREYGQIVGITNLTDKAKLREDNNND